MPLLLPNGNQVLRIFISPNGTSMDPSKISAVQDWPAPKRFVNFKSFLGFQNFYRALFLAIRYYLSLDKVCSRRRSIFLGDQSKKTSFKRLKEHCSTRILSSSE
ncbi:hypothetical protein BASA83_013215 [Batrachochytrium salamandrivorans]|nr:hypothetical protein BASA83_013215 [Batrachochytrium salamandrivorans]